MKEIIVAVAFNWNELIISMPSPARHHNVIANMFKARMPKEAAFMQNQGFITNTGRFVNRNEAFKIAKEANQLKNNNLGSAECLISEDLW